MKNWRKSLMSYDANSIQIRDFRTAARSTPVMKQLWVEEIL